MAPQHRNSDLACMWGGKPFTALLLRLFSCDAQAHATALTRLGLVAGAGHPALEEAEGPADFVLLRLGLRRDYVFIPLLILDPVSGGGQGH